MAAKKKSDKNKRFEELLGDLESIVDKLEDQEPELEDAIEAYERGMELSRECHKRLGPAGREEYRDILSRG